MVTDSIIGRRHPSSAKTSSAADNAALTLSVSKIVSNNNKSTPHSTRVSICSRYAVRNISKSTARRAGSSTSGDIEAVLPVGPTEPATKRGLSGVKAVIRSASARARATAARFISRTALCIPYSACEMACALNVHVVIISAPASKYSRCMAEITSARVMASRSLLPASFTGCEANSAPRKSSSAR